MPPITNERHEARKPYEYTGARRWLFVRKHWITDQDEELGPCYLPIRDKILAIRGRHEVNKGPLSRFERTLGTNHSDLPLRDDRERLGLARSIPHRIRQDKFRSIKTAKKFDGRSYRKYMADGADA